MLDKITDTISRNIKNIPYFFTYKQLDEKNVLLNKLSSSIIHDILTPLTAIKLATNLDNQDQTRQIIEDSTEQITEFIYVLKSFIENNDIKEVNINKEIQNIIKLLKNRILEHNLQLQFIEFDTIKKQINPLYIYQIVINLISNAIEATKNSNEKKILLLIKKGRDHFQIECRDFGTGIATNTQNKIYEFNYSTKESTGIGLYSIKNVVNILKGKIEIKSEPNNGSLFTITLPL